MVKSSTMFTHHKRGDLYFVDKSACFESIMIGASIANRCIKLQAWLYMAVIPAVYGVETGESLGFDDSQNDSILVRDSVSREFSGERQIRILCVFFWSPYVQVYIPYTYTVFSVCLCLVSLCLFLYLCLCSHLSFTHRQHVPHF